MKKLKKYMYTHFYKISHIKTSLRELMEKTTGTGRASDSSIANSSHELAEEKFAELRNILKSEWQLVKKEDNITIEKKILPGSEIACFKAMGHVNAEAKILFDYVRHVYDSFDGMKEHDKKILEFEIIEKINDNTKICYQINSLVWPIWSRDLLYVQTTKFIDNEYWIYMYSTESDKKPIQKDKYVRAKLNISAFGFVPDKNGTMVYRIAHIDPAGNIPTKVINSYASKITTMIYALRKRF